MTTNELKTIEIKNLNISQRESKIGKTYYIIFDDDKQDFNNAYFCFRGAENLNHDDFTKLEENWDKITQIQLEYKEDEKGKRVISFKYKI